MFYSLMNIISKFIEKENTHLISEILEILINSILNINDNSIEEYLINLLIKGLNSNNQDIGKIFNDSMNIILKVNKELLGKLFEKISNIFIKEEHQIINNYLIESFKKLIQFNLFKNNVKTNFNINEYAEKLVKDINDELSINLNNPKIPDNKLINEISILSVIIEKNTEIRNNINEKTNLFDNLLNNIIFNSSKSEKEEETIMTDSNNNNEEEEKMEFINIDTLNNSSSNRLNNINLQNECYNLTLRLLKFNLINFNKFFNL